jgi:hypothetical protein
MGIVKYLVDKGANIHDFDDYALLWSAANGHLEIVEYLVEKGANVHNVIQRCDDRIKCVLKKYIKRELYKGPIND